MVLGDLVAEGFFEVLGEHDFELSHHLGHGGFWLGDSEHFVDEGRFGGVGFGLGVEQGGKEERGEER
jgi:hypothetical protein